MTAKTLVKKVQFDSAVQSEEDKFLQCKRWREEGEKLAEAGKYHQALTCLEACIGLTPEHHLPHELKAQVLLELGESFKAIQAAEKCIILDPTFTTGFLTLARAQLNFGEPEMAGENIKKAKELEPNNEEIDTQLRDIEEILKQKKERESKTTIETTQG